jgi:zinc transport system substrate-binding protein
MVALASARIYFRGGIPFESSVVDKIGSVFEELNVVDLRKGIDLRPTAGGHDCELHHRADPETRGETPAGGGGDRGDSHHEDHHDHGELDPHIWMNPRLVQTQARTICEELCHLDPANRADYERNLEVFLTDLERVDQEIKARLAPLRGRAFYVFHAAYGYFADAYGLQQVAVAAGGRQPTAKQLGTLIRQAKEAGINLIFVQPQFDQRTAGTIAEAIGGTVVPVDPLAENYLDNLLDVASKVEAALTVTRKPGDK